MGGMPQPLHHDLFHQLPTRFLFYATGGKRFINDVMPFQDHANHR